MYIARRMVFNTAGESKKKVHIQVEIDLIATCWKHFKQEGIALNILRLLHKERLHLDCNSNWICESFNVTSIKNPNMHE